MLTFWFTINLDFYLFFVLFYYSISYFSSNTSPLNRERASLVDGWLTYFGVVECLVVHFNIEISLHREFYMKGSDDRLILPKNK